MNSKLSDKLFSIFAKKNHAAESKLNYNKYNYFKNYAAFSSVFLNGIIDIFFNGSAPDDYLEKVVDYLYKVSYPKQLRKILSYKIDEMSFNAGIYNTDIIPKVQIADLTKKMKGLNHPGIDTGIKKDVDAIIFSKKRFNLIPKIYHLNKLKTKQSNVEEDTLTEILENLYSYVDHVMTYTPYEHGFSNSIRNDQYKFIELAKESVNKSVILLYDRFKDKVVVVPELIEGIDAIPIIYNNIAAEGDIKARVPVKVTLSPKTYELIVNTQRISIDFFSIAFILDRELYILGQDRVKRTLKENSGYKINKFHLLLEKEITNPN